MKLTKTIVLLMGLIFTSFLIAGAEDAATAAQDKPVKTRTTSVKKKRVLKSSAPKSNKSVSMPTSSTATENKPAQRESMMTWLKDLKKRVARSQARQNQIVAVAAVRGNETPDSPPLYWKGKKSSGNVEMPELKEFELAIDNAMAGKSEDSKLQLQELVTKYPNSPLVADAQEILKKLDEPIAQ